MKRLLIDRLIEWRNKSHRQPLILRGALTEQYVCQQLQVLDRLDGNYYWTSQSKAEIDFLLTDGLRVMPLECKAGYTMNAKSMKSYCERYAPSLSLRTSLLPYTHHQDSVINIPLYMIFALDKEI